MAGAGGAIRALFVAGFVVWYSTGVFRAMDTHFGNHFGQFLRTQIRANEHMRKDLEADRRAMERVLQARGKELPPAPQEEDDKSLLEKLMQRIRGAEDTADRQHGLRPLEEASCDAVNDNVQHQEVQDSVRNVVAVDGQDDAHDTFGAVEALIKYLVRDTAADFCPAARGPPVCQAPPPPPAA